MSRNKPPTETRSPLKAPPLAQAGDSLFDEMHELILMRFGMWMSIAGVLAVMALMEWMRWYMQTPPTPIVSTAIAVIGIAAAIIIWRRAKVRVECIRLGRRGEIIVAQELERLRSEGFEVFHDIEGKGFNIDHLLIGPAGVFVIETKTLSKKIGAENKISFDGAKVHINGHTPDRDPITQVVTAKKWLSEILERATSHKPFVRPVVLYPGWWVDRQPSGAEVWVLNPKALPEFIRNEPLRLRPEEVAQIATAIETRLRARAEAAIA